MRITHTSSVREISCKNLAIAQNLQVEGILSFSCCMTVCWRSGPGPTHPSKNTVRFSFRMTFSYSLQLDAPRRFSSVFCFCQILSWSFTFFPFFLSTARTTLLDAISIASVTSIYETRFFFFIFEKGAKFVLHVHKICLMTTRVLKLPFMF